MNRSKSVLFFLFLISISCFSQSQQDRLIAHYSFNGDAHDMSGNENHGIVYGANLAEGRFNIPNSAYYFDGIDDHIVILDNEIFQLIDNKLTVSIWAKINYPANKFFIYKGDTQFNREYHIGLRIDSLASFAINNRGGWGTDQFGVASKTVLKSENWYHIVGCWDGLSQKIYINGILENTSTPDVEIGDYESDLYIGTFGGDIERYAINAIIDDIKIYNSALTENEIIELYKPNLIANFSADTTIGIVPLNIQFSDQSTACDSINVISSWQWDFDNDGIVDSEERNPQWSYRENGLYSVRLTVSDSIKQDVFIKENYISAISDNPFITTVNDIPNDQGRLVEVQFLRSAYDTDSLILPETMSPELYTIELNDGIIWHAAATTEAYGKSFYSVSVPTTQDSTNKSNGLINFRVIAGMEEGNFVSNVKSGYSIDNLIPSIPQGLAAKMTEGNNVKLTWSNIPDDDFNYFCIYRNNENYFDQSSQPISQSIVNTYTDNNLDSGATYYYSIKSVDLSGNESDFSDVFFIILTSTSEELKYIPSYNYLAQNYPNPFNPTTTIVYSLLISSNVELKIYDLLGNEISTLVDDYKMVGIHEINFDGSSLSSGVYYYTLKAGKYIKSRKFIVLK